MVEVGEHMVETFPLAITDWHGGILEVVKLAPAEHIYQLAECVG